MRFILALLSLAALGAGLPTLESDNAAVERSNDHNKPIMTHQSVEDKYQDAIGKLKHALMWYNDDKNKPENREAFEEAIETLASAIKLSEEEMQYGDNGNGGEKPSKCGEKKVCRA